MKAVVVTEMGKAPVYREFNDPTPSDGEVCVTVTASALSVFRGRHKLEMQVGD